ncbi:hypothetical protein JTE90_011140 [Oedothorax gibbosus]|uniref:Uncharacterized protein n=1 Tax=Oedothorax gibbosus TaxID=931172 RepID=A0AAV6TKQ9_9ARAC|nr:hypothetical protein JTE90_011140 [Oedothorax gibbosus]
MGRPARKLHILPRIFKGQQRPQPTPQETGAFTSNSVPISGTSRSRDTNSTRKITLPRPPCDGSVVGGVGLLPHLVPKGPISVPGLEDRLNPCSTAVHMEPFLSFSRSRLPTEYLLLPTTICTVAAPGGLHSRTFNHATGDPPLSCG